MNRYGRLQLRQRELRGQPLELLALQLHAMAPEVGGGRKRCRFAVTQRTVGASAAAASGSASSPSNLRIQAVDDDRSERHADVVLEVVGGVDELVDRRLLGQRHEHHLAALGVGEHLEHVAGLAVDRSDPYRVEQAPRRQQERDGVAGRGCVEDDQVGLAGRARAA